MNDRKLVVIARVLLPSGWELLLDGFELREGGLEGGRDELLELVPGASAIIADSSVPIDGEVLDAAGEGLQVVSNFAVGYDNVDLDACRQRGVAVTNTPGVLTEATAELALALTLAAGRRMGDAERDLRDGRWQGWDPAAYLGIELREATVAVIGLGRIGSRYAELVAALGAEVVYASRSAKPEAEEALGARRLELAEACELADVVSVHAPAGPDTLHLIGAAEIGLIGPKGVLVNTSRGSLVDNLAVAAALRDGRLGAAGLDVYENEPEVPRELLEAPRAVLLPHIGSATQRSRDGMARLAAENAIAVLEGREPESRVA
jgi:glyoxylate reductase